MTFGDYTYHPDAHWQGTEMAYHFAYGDQVPSILTWEWQDKYTLRSTLYPAYLSIPLHVLRFLKIDSNCLVNNSLYLMHCLLIVVGDYYMYHVAKMFIGKRGAAVTMLYLLFNFTINQIFSKTLTNGAESVFCQMAFYYFARLKPKFDRNMALMTLSITLAFIVRSSSLIGFIPLALFQMFQSCDDFLAILQSAIFVALPTFTLSIVCDSIYYGKWACPQYNFVYVNVVEDITAYFGVEPWDFYQEQFEEGVTVFETLFPFFLAGFSVFAAFQFHG